MHQTCMTKLDSTIREHDDARSYAIVSGRFRITKIIAQIYKKVTM